MNYDEISIKNRFSTHKYRYVKAGIPQDVTIDEMLDLFANHNAICDLCDKHMQPADVNIDHIISLSNGGMHTINNMQLVHKSCNSIKRDKDNDLARWLCKKRDKYRHCPCCDCIKPLTMWHKNGDYEYSRCKQCHRECADTWKKENKERLRKDLAEPEPSTTNYASATF